MNKFLKLILAIVCILSVTLIVFFTLDYIDSKIMRVISGVLLGSSLALTLYFQEFRSRKILSFIISVLFFISNSIGFYFSTSSTYFSLIIIGVISVFFYWYFSKESHFSRD